MKEEPMQITIDTTQPLSATDTTILQLLLDGDAAVPVTEAPAEPTPAPAKKTTARKTAAPKAKDPDPTPADETTDGPSLDDAVARAQELVGLKLTQGVKDAVKEITGEVKRVSELTGDEIGQFLDAVKDLGKDDDSVV